MQQRSRIDLELRASLLTYAAKLAPSQAPGQLVIGPIWQYWHSGRDNAPEICRTCLDSVCHFAADRPITILDDSSLHQYVHLPSHILARRGQMSITHFSDILRSHLLAEHGGTWIDATVFLSGSIEHITSNLPFFALTRPNDPLMLSSWFMHSVRGHPLMCALRDMLTDYWQENELLLHYNLLHFLFECAITLHSGLRRSWERTPFVLSGEHGLARKLQAALRAGLSQAFFHEICSQTPVHKLSWKIGNTALAEAEKLRAWIRM